MAAEKTTRDAKLVQYLTEAYGTEKHLEAALEAHIAMTSRAAYRKRLRQHLSDTKRHARVVEKRIKQLGGSSALGEVAAGAQALAGRALAAAQGPLHAVRGTGEAEKQLKNAKTEYASEAEEIATYAAIEALAANVGDRETEQLARAIRREEERMARYLERLIPTLTRAVVTAEIPARERNGGRARRRRTTTRRAPTRRAPTRRAPTRRATTRTRSTRRARSR
jgi:ferritin-like metal-binding protein YciE